MKSRLLIILIALCATMSLSAQFTPQGFNYQSIVRNASGNPVVNQTVTLLFSIRSGAPNGPVAYSEKQTVSTNEFGLVNLVIGQGGTPLQGTFGGINWGGGAKYLTVALETSPNVFDELGSSQLMSVPYALYAQNAANAGGGGDNWGSQTVQTTPALGGNGTPANPLSIAQQGATTGQVLKWDGSKWVPQDDISDTGASGGTVTQINTGAGLTGGPITTSGTVSLTNTGVAPGIYGSATEIPVITVDAQGRVTDVFKTIVQPGTVGIDGGAGIDVQQNGFNFVVTNTGDTDPSNDLTTSSTADGDVSGPFGNLQIKANAVGTPEIANGSVTGAKLNDMGASNNQVLKWNGTTWAPQADAGITAVGLTAGAGISVSGSSPNFTVTNTGDTDPSNDLTTASTANGDVAGPFSDLQIKADVVTTTELANNAVETANIANQAVTGAKIDDMGASTGQVLKWNGTTWTPQADATGAINLQMGPGIDITNAGNTYTIINSGDIDAFDDVTTSTQAGGDLSGPFSNLQIKSFIITNNEMANNSIGTTNIINGSITGNKLNNMGAGIGQVLKWNGTAWAPAADDTGTGGDNWGIQTVVSDAMLTGVGTVGSPLKIAQQGATPNQVLKWNGSTWFPAADGGDNWGVQTAAVGSALTGNGTAGNPLNLAQQGASSGKVLKWNGTAWVPGDDDGDNWGTQAVWTGPALTGNGTFGSPVNLDQQGATTGQVLQWSGTAWVPASVSGDNWGGQVAITDATLSGGGTVGSPLKIAQQGAAPNQVLKWNGSNWFPAADGGDNWGAQTAAVGSALTGNGTAGNPLNLAQQGATSGEVLKWNGSAWVPGDDEGDNWGTQAVWVGPALTGNGTFASPVNLAQQGAAPGQVLQWSGSAWAPASFSGDNWGAQVVVTGSSVAGNGTAGNPLALAQQGAVAGEVLKWNGSAWVPGGDAVGGTGDIYNGGTGISISGASPNFTINNTGDLSNTNEIQTLSLAGNQISLSLGGGMVTLPADNNYSAGTGISITGLAPNFTINNTGDLDNNPTNEIQALSILGDQLTLTNGGNTVTLPSGDNYSAGTGISISGSAPNFTINNTGDADNNPANEIQMLSILGDQLTLTNGGNTVTLPSGDNYSAGTGISITGSAPNFTINNTGDLDNSPTNEIQTLSLLGDQLTLTNGGTVTLPSGNTYTAGTGISITGSAPNFTIINTGDADNNPTNELQTLNLTGTVLGISGSGSSVDFTDLLNSVGAGYWKLDNDHIYNTNSANVLIGTNASTSGKLQVTGDGSGPAGFFTSDTGPALVTGNGNVGIRKNNPSFRLDVGGDGRFASSDATPQLTVEQLGAGAASMLLKNTGTGGWQLSGSGGGSALFSLDFTPSVTTTPILTANSTGHVGVGGVNNSAAALKVFHKDLGLSLENTTNGHRWDFGISDPAGNLVLFNDQLGAIPAGTFSATTGIYLPSDRRLKKDIAAIPMGVLNKLMQLQPVSYRYKVENESAKRSLGFLAQDVQCLFPELVGESQARNGEGTYLSLNYAGFGILAVKAIQEQQQQIESLKTENEALRAQLESFETRLKRLEKR